MRRRFAVQLRYVLWALIIGFVITLPLIFVPGGLGGGRRENQQPEVESADVVATVDGKPVSRADVTRSFNRMVQQVLPYYAQLGQSIGLGELWRLRYDAMEQAVQNRLVLEAARAQGISVSGGELKKQAQQLVDQEIAQLKSQYQGPQVEQVFARIAAKKGQQRPRETMGERQFADWAMTRYLDETSGLRDDLVIQKLRQAVTSQLSASEQDLLQSYDKAAVRRIVISLHPAGKPARTDEQAKKRAEELLARIRGGADFPALARADSDDPGAKQTGGLMEGVGRGRMAAEWDRAVFALSPGQVSAPIEAPWGYEIVRMEKIGRELPPGFDKSKKQLLTSFLEQRRGQAWQKFVVDLRKKAKLDVPDPEMQAYQALAQSKPPDQVLAKLDEAKQQAQSAGGLEAASVFYQLGTLLADKKSKKGWSDAADAYAEAADALSGDEGALLPGGRAEALMGMAHAYENLGQTKDAVMWYTTASEATELPAIHSQLLTTFQRLAQQDLAKKEQEWMANYQQEQRDRQAEMETQRKAAERKSQPKPTPPAPPQAP
jgi:parvulin-like peptidyl-prolyl isomerase